jgi:multidrug efflux pump subunit AcrB
MTPGAVVAQLQQANARGDAGSFSRDNQEFAVEAGRFLGTAADSQQIVVAVAKGVRRTCGMWLRRLTTVLRNQRITFFTPTVRRQKAAHAGIIRR